MQISNYLSAKHHQYWLAASDAQCEYWKISATREYRLDPDILNAVDLMRPRATIAASALYPWLDDKLGRGPSRLTELRHTRGNTLTKRCGNEAVYWRQVLGGGVNLGLKVFLHGAAHVASFLTMGQIFRAVAPPADLAEPVISRSIDRKLARAEVAVEPFVRGLNRVFRYFEGHDNCF